MSWGVGRRCGSDPVLLWRRSATAALMRLLAWELPCASGAALKSPPPKKRIEMFWFLELKSWGKIEKMMVYTDISVPCTNGEVSQECISQNTDVARWSMK